MVRQPLEQVLEVRLGHPAGPRRDRATSERTLGVRHDEVRVDLQLGTEAIARRARTIGAVEREGARLDFVDADRVAVGARHVLGEAAHAIRIIIRQVHEIRHDDAFCQAQRGFDRIGDALLRRRLDRDPVDDDVDIVLFLLLELRWLAQLDPLPVHHRPGIALRGEVLEEIDELALARADDGREYLEPRALLHFENLVDDLLRSLAGNNLPTRRTMRRPCACIQQTEVVVHLGNRADCGPRVAVGRLLVDGHRRRQSLDEVHVRLVHLAEEHAGISGQRLDIPALPLGEDRVEGEGRFSGAGQSREHHERVPRDVDIHALEVVLAGAANYQPIDQLPLLSNTVRGKTSPRCGRHQRTGALP